MRSTRAFSAEQDAVRIGLLGALVLGLVAAEDIGFGDSGELGTAAVVLGVAHPTGFALDMLWLKAASLVPLGHLAFRLNVATALIAGLALGLCAAVIGALCERVGVTEVKTRRLGVLAGVSALAGFGTFVLSARAVEVYALALSAVLLALYVATVGGRAAGLLALLLGLAAGMHVTAGLYIAPVALLYLLASGPGWLRVIAVHAPLFAVGGAVLAYLPLASLRDPPLDWGDPETLQAVLAHLSAERIRSAYRDDMFGGHTSAPSELFGQLRVFAGLAGSIIVAALVVVRGERLTRARGGGTESDARPRFGPRSSARALLLCVGLIGVGDLAYAALINPMGVRDSQCGHVAGACLAVLGGVSVAALVVRLLNRPRSQRLLRYAIAIAALSQLSMAFDTSSEDGYVLGEVLGSGGALATLPPRTLFLCTSDDGCAGSLFALHAERVRPDMATAPAQHLWDATVLRRITGFTGRPAATPVERAERARDNARAILQGTSQRPLALEARRIAEQLDPALLLAPLGDAPFLTPTSSVAHDAFKPALERLHEAHAARFGRDVADGQRARELWSRLFGELGAAALRTPAFLDGVGALRRAAFIAPQRATAWVNLGVALETMGQLPEALEVTRRAISVEPTRASGWVNLVRLKLKLGDVEGARRSLQGAARFGVEDARLQELMATVNSSSPSPSATPQAADR